ncbi:acyltransferase family protein [Algoriphagus sp. PAP.12]|uniref:acyltransferase family protein n=1 Tax=Algoriphagus sp. PAP.12 TaxID=2996678 RepID=UPI00227C0729|nr:acyltransferase [Algoriphagus sp. PAP.12]
MSPNKKLGYIPGLDGLRAIAVGLVMLGHSNIYIGQNGGIGVDVFFALSGFLITTILLEEKDEYGEINLKYFYSRRFLRLFPALAFLLIVTSFLVFIFWKSNSKIYIEEFIASFFYIYNISWYWGLAEEPFILYHMWSLAVEEQYYIWWPLLLIIVHRFLNEKQFSIFLLIVSILIFCFRFYFIKFLFFNSIFMDSIFFGCSLALLRRQFQLKFLVNNYLLFFSTFLILFFSIVNLDFGYLLLRSGYRGVFGILSCIIIINIVSNRKNLFRYSIFVFFGKLSYSLYLWHLVIFVLFRKITLLADYQHYLLKIIVSILMAVISYFTVELYFLKISKKYFSVLR